MVCVEVSRGLIIADVQGRNKPLWVEGDALCSRGLRLELLCALASIASSERSGGKDMPW